MTGDGKFSVSVAKDYLTFSAAHFLTIPNHKCAALHGHNYVVTVIVEGMVDPATGFVVDFADVKRILRPAIDRLDHRVLVPTRNSKLTVREEAGSTTVSSETRRFVFPTADVALVAVTDTTAELLAAHLAEEVQEGFRGVGVTGVTRLTVDLEESPGQSGRYQLTFA